MNEPLSSIMSTKLITVGPEASLQEAKQKLSSASIHHLLVVNSEQELLGVITLRDFVKHSNTPDLDGVSVKDVMTTRLAVLEPSDKIGAAAEVFLENLFHAVPIVKDNKLLGIVTTFDVLKYQFDKEYPNNPIQIGRGA